MTVRPATRPSSRRSTRIRVSPRRTTEPTCSRARPFTGRSSSSVPWLEPASSISGWDALTSTRAWRRETDGSSRVTSQSSPRPSVIVCVSGTRASPITRSSAGATPRDCGDPQRAQKSAPRSTCRLQERHSMSAGRRRPQRLHAGVAAADRKRGRLPGLGHLDDRPAGASTGSPGRPRTARRRCARRRRGARCSRRPWCRPRTGRG